jgi:hypothetical protein
MADLGSPTLCVRRRARRFVVVGLFAAVVLVGAGCGGGRTGPSPSAAITDFNPGETTINASFAALNTLARTHTDQLRAVALEQLNNSSPNVHYAAVYALSLTAQSGQGSAELGQMLTATDTTDRLLAAGSLASIGDSSAIPVLIAALSSDEELAYDDEQSVFEFAQAELIYFTNEDFGLRTASGLAAVSATQPAWQQWWSTKGPSLHFDATTRKYS